MATISSTPRTGRLALWNWLAAYPFTMLAALFLIGMAFPFLLRHDSEWEDVYVRAAHHLWAGETIYRPDEGYVYPPFMAVLALPLALLPQPAERLVWYLINAVCTVLLCRWAWQLAGGGRLEGRAPVAWSERLACTLGLACGFRYVIDGLAHQQTDVVLGALVLGGCCALRAAKGARHLLRRRPASASPRAPSVRRCSGAATCSGGGSGAPLAGC